ncbi:helix-turn-helix transcriptional regulator [Paractinoplanes atraurantiacus]|uniref:Helix-turn-helix domain-containing protein n=1 Tax=Paractinoplanes atraurantiacus TaxID=1036182 RepID=A0A285K8F5_9ACTN|nr:helix-turn-helix transcriptional regulator [Actinoplanes atraurantiacus]SNY68894.1 Helix-turn-helix domain-containing protein [Actinoplanes atraurantiacus]
MDRARLAEYLRTRREALQPEDVGLPRGQRRRTRGLRREEVAVLSDMSIDYYSRLEQPRGPHPSEQMLGAIARGLRLSLEERDHLFELAGYATPRRVADSEHVNPGMMRIFDGLQDSAAMVVSPLGETLLQTRLAVALVGDESIYTGLDRSKHYRWFTDPSTRSLYPRDEWDEQSRLIVADLHASYTRDGQDSRAGAIVDALLAASPSFAALWKGHPVAGPYCGPVRLLHPEVGPLELDCQRLVDPDRSQQLVVYTAKPGSLSQERLRLLSVIGTATSPGTASW